jgi:hypothetical protein
LVVVVVVMGIINAGPLCIIGSTFLYGDIALSEWHPAAPTNLQS